ncbi:TniQ family protein [Mesobacillus selenatarsenatis]|uniref:TniQ family protein n=1 Tax=Mesobacillus selenatarsenatis TaxID=388741 RepID=A0A846TCX9_9BACI|nr:TniQ family protein [Mesobacillus selenatarsenatis]NKE04669.1 TniQ family protein [Mesobacillus selenatarsenatis]
MGHHLSIRCKTKSGESLLSYLLRLANSNDVPLLTLLNTFRHPDRQYYIQKANLDLICYSPKHIIDVKELVKTVRLSEEEIEKCSFHYMLGHFSDEKNIPHLRILSGVIRNVLYYCPKCLMDSNYYRLLWKVKDVTVCLQHECYLLDKCLHCKKPIYYRDLLQVGKCPYCKNSLFKTAQNLPHDHELQEQRWIQAQWMFLLFENGKVINLQELSLRVLFLLNGKKTDEISRQLIGGILNLSNGTEKLLQHARGTRIDSRTLHINLLIRILREINSSFEQLFSIDVPASFSRVVCQNKKRSGDKGISQVKDVKQNRERVDSLIIVLKQCLKDGEDISLKNICEKLGVSRGTIRKWGCNEVIAKYKGIQKELNLQRKKEKINLQLDIIFSMPPNYLTSEFVYKQLGVNRTVLWRSAPEITAFITDQLKKAKGGGGDENGIRSFK